VYYSKSPEGREYAIKIYKTSILVFKDRDRYVSGEEEEEEEEEEDNIMHHPFMDPFIH